MYKEAITYFIKINRIFVQHLYKSSIDLQIMDEHLRIHSYISTDRCINVNNTILHIHCVCSLFCSSIVHRKNREGLTCTRYDVYVQHVQRRDKTNWYLRRKFMSRTCIAFVMTKVKIIRKFLVSRNRTLIYFEFFFSYNSAYGNERGVLKLV